jgi:hypothetical protein
MTATEDTRITFDPIRLEQQKKYLDLLAVFHYVVGGLAFMVSLFFTIHITLGLAILVNPQAFDGAEPPPAFLGCFIAGIGVTVLLFFWAYAALTAYAGRCLARRRRYVLCLVSAAISCLFSPFGTVLGIFTIILLMQNGVREALFARGEATAARYH